MNYPGTLNAGPEFKSFSDRLMSARFCADSVLEKGQFDFAAFIGPQSPELARMIAATEVRGASELGQLSCRIMISTDTGESVNGELLNGGSELAIDWDTIDEWGMELWSAAGRPRTPSARRCQDEAPAGGDPDFLKRRCRYCQQLSAWRQQLYAQTRGFFAIHGGSAATGFVLAGSKRDSTRSVRMQYEYPAARINS